MFDSSRLQRLIEQNFPDPPPPTQISAPATGPTPASDVSPPAGSPSQRGDRGGASRGRGRGERGGSRPASAAVNDAVSVEKKGSNEESKPNRGRGGGRGGRGGKNSNNHSATNAGNHAIPDADGSQSQRHRGGKRGGARGGGRGDGAKANSNEPSNDAAPGEAKFDGPSKKELAQAAAKARAETKAAAEAWLDDPSNPANIPSPALATELAQINRRYDKSFKQSKHRSSITCSFSFSPTDPDFPFALPPEKCVLQFTFNDISLYPYGPLPERNDKNEAQIERLKCRVIVECLNEEKDIPRFMRDVIVSGISQFIHTSQFGHPQILRNTIKFADKEILDWLLLAQKRHNALIEKTVAKLTGGAAIAASSSASTNTAPPTTAPTANTVVAAPSTITLPVSALPPAPSSSPALPSPSPSPAAVVSSSNPSDPGFDDVEPEDVWTEQQQSALERGLKTVSKTLPPAERWEQIAALVDGKTKKQVIARYKSIREKVRLESMAAETSASASSVVVPSLTSNLSLLTVSNAQEVDLDETQRLHAQRVLQQQLDREEEARRKQEEEDERKRELENGGKMKKKPQKEQKGSGSSDDEAGDEVKEFQPVTERLSLNPQHRGTQILVGEVEMSGLGIIKTSILRAQLLCVRCESRVDIEFTPSNGAHNPCTERCPRCGIALVVAYRPEMVHEHSDSLGYVDLENGELFDILPSDFLGTCLECFTEYAMKSLQRGMKQEGNCRSCHTKLEWKIGTFELDRITQATVNYVCCKTRDGPKEDTRGKKAAAAIDPREVLAAKNRSKEQALLKLGTPLPNKGACKHYKHSYRWMRFPCCGKAYPCDDCHNAAEDHPGVWATRMICGNCSKEQAFSSKPCTSCGMAFSTQAKTFWEGGAGMRDRNRLSRNDSRKHSGLMKTTSMKSSRVGQKAGKENSKPKPKGNNTG